MHEKTSWRRADNRQYAGWKRADNRQHAGWRRADNRHRTWRRDNMHEKTDGGEQITDRMQERRQHGGGEQTT